MPTVYPRSGRKFLENSEKEKKAFAAPFLYSQMQDRFYETETAPQKICASRTAHLIEHVSKPLRRRDAVLSNKPRFRHSFWHRCARHSKMCHREMDRSCPIAQQICPEPFQLTLNRPN